jgi:type I restriction enzyme S subunit
MTGKYRAYPEYKNSGVEWLGDIPAHWQISPLKYLCSFSGGGTPSKEKPEYWSGDIPWVSPKDMKSSLIISTIDNVTELAVKQSSTSLVGSGALLMVVRSGILQHSIPVAINDVPVTLNQDMKALRLNSRLNVKYLMYFISGNQAQLLLEWGKQGATVESIE